MASVLVTGTNQGIGFGLVKRLSSRHDVDRVFATVRDPNSAASTEIKNLKSSSEKIYVIKLELNEKSADAAVAEVDKILSGKGLDILINNIGIAHDPYDPEETPLSLFRKQFEVNVLGPQMVIAAFLPLLRKGNKKTILNISTVAGSITYNDGRFPFKVPAYGVSKAAR